MRHIYLVTYDIRHARRLRRIHKLLRGYGDALQYSVFRCELTLEMHRQLLRGLRGEINPEQDRILIVSLGPVCGRLDQAIQTLGQPVQRAERQALIV